MDCSDLLDICCDFLVLLFCGVYADVLTDVSGNSSNCNLMYSAIKIIMSTYFSVMTALWDCQFKKHRSHNVQYNINIRTLSLG